MIFVQFYWVPSNKGERLAEEFVMDRLVVPEGSTTPKKSLYDPIKHSNTKTMALMTKGVIVRDKNISLDGETMYMRLLAMNSTKKLPLYRIMKFENAPVPLSLFAEDGTMRSCVKSDFMHKLEEIVDGGCRDDITEADIVIFDGHTVPP